MVHAGGFDQPPSVVQDAIGKRGPGAQRTNALFDAQRVNASSAGQSRFKSQSLANDAVVNLSPCHLSAQISGSSPSACERAAPHRNLDLRGLKGEYIAKVRQDDDSSSCSGSSPRSSAHTEPQDDVNDDPYLHGTEGFWGAMLGPGIVEDLDAHKSDLATEDVESKRLSDDFIRQALHIVDAFEASKGLPASSDWMHPLNLDYEGELAINPIKLNGDLLE